MSTGLPVLVIHHVYLTAHGSPRACLVALSLDTVEYVMVGQVDELEEDVG